MSWAGPGSVGLRGDGGRVTHRNLAAANGNSPGDFGADLTDESLVLHLAGDWTIDHVGALDGRLRGLPVPSAVRRAALDLGEVEALDTAGAWLVHRTRRELEARGIEVELHGAAGAQRTLIEAVASLPSEGEPEPKRASPLIDLVARTGEATIELARESVRLVGFFGMLAMKTARVLVQPRRLRLISLAYHIEATGVSAVPIVGLLSFLIGVVLAYQGADQLRQFGAEIFVVDLLGISVLRELGVLMTAIIVAGRSGSAFTAQIGTMKVNQEVDAMQTLGLDPVDVLVLPRAFALMITLPLLVFFADLVALFGGATMSNFVLDISYGQFMRQFQSAVDVGHFWVGMVKAPVFAFTIAMVGCYEGLKVSGSAESVGRLTTASVVRSIFLVIVLDAVFSVLFAVLGI